MNNSPWQRQDHKVSKWSFQVGLGGPHIKGECDGEILEG